MLLLFIPTNNLIIGYSFAAKTIVFDPSVINASTCSYFLVISMIGTVTSSNVAPP